MSDDDRIAGVISQEHIGAAICEDAFDLLRRVEVGNGVLGLITKEGALEILDKLANIETDMLQRVDPSAVGRADLYTWIQCLISDRDRRKANATDHERELRKLAAKVEQQRLEIEGRERLHHAQIELLHEAEAEVEVMREALEPFAEWQEARINVNAHAPPGAMIGLGTSEGETRGVTDEDLERARLALRDARPRGDRVDRRCRAGHTYVTTISEPGRCWCGEAAALEVVT